MANIITNINQVCADLTNIKKAITDTGVEISSGTPSSEYAEKINDVYNSGVAYIDDIVIDTNSGLEAVLYGTGEGGKSWYDAFWDDFQHKGNRVNYNYAFFDGSGATQAWGDVSFNPKYPIKPLEATSTFQGLAVTGELTSKVEIDLSEAKSIMNCFAYAHSITRLGVIDCRAVTQNHITFCANCTSLKTIDEVILKNDGTQVHSLSSWNFSNCVNLRNIKITGVIPFNVNLQYSPLSKESITSVINALSSTATGLTATFKKTAKEAAFTEEEWQALIGTKTNWSISLV